ncbi:hypothetical protein [Rubellicoccus peritrichatus]|uniref:PEP-CTERM protein-sorting domain-containing protein n=1 Tax=Rubellicoccus peritrichatus TaxID=3080537 RepID=A0AAQ3L549_9BACT|nr:hypothetical protein [Puniceicoccus sp. CR14]WOO39569.1 hypothetical protein RZN69_13175 [Puniceicoccus sp. CR14]
MTRFLQIFMLMGNITIMKLPLYLKSISSVVLLNACFSSITQAAFVPLGTSGDDPNNYGTFSGVVLDSVTLNGQTYGTSSLVQVSLTAFAGATSSVLLQQNGGVTNPTAQQRRDFLETDWRGDTGIINPSAVAGSVQANFNVPVRNIAGADMFLYEINTAATGDAFDIIINGMTLTVGASDYGDSGANTNSADVLSVGSTPTTLTQLLNNPAGLSSGNISQNILGVGIDFSDFGVADGATVTSFSYNSGNVTSFDPVLIAAVPEPHTYSMIAGFFVVGIAFLRRRFSV